jgi:DNA-binding NarL/FixJ family response regulator
MNEKPVRVLIADDQSLFREALRALLVGKPELELVGEASDGLEAIARVAALDPDVLLLDLKMPRLDGIGAIRRVRAEYPRTKVLVLTTFDDDELIFEGLRAGAVGYLLKDATSERLLEAILTVARGESFLQPTIAAKVIAEFSRLPPRADATSALGLSSREREVLKLLAAGASNKEIARSLLLTEGTVKNHVTSILTKLGVTDRTQAAIKARDVGLS